jgi:hypothetical protein
MLRCYPRLTLFLPNLDLIIRRLGKRNDLLNIEYN